MADTPDREINFRSSEGATGGDDFQDADDTLPDRRSHGYGDGPVCSPQRGNRDDHFRNPAYGVAVKPELYDGTEDWEEYISHFEVCAELGRWRPYDRVLALAAALKGPARTFYISLSTAEKRDYDVLIQRLGQRFGSTRQQNRWLSRLEARKRKPGESIAALADDLRQMAQRAYTDLDNRAQEVLALNQLYKNVAPEVKYQCTSHECRTVTYAVEIIERYEAILGDSTEKKRASVRAITEKVAEKDNDPTEISLDKDDIKTLAKRIEELESRSRTEQHPANKNSRPRFNTKTNSSTTQRRELRCYLCNSPDHLCRRCPIFIRCQEEMNNQGSSQTSSNQQSKPRNQGNFGRPLAH